MTRRLYAALGTLTLAALDHRDQRARDARLARLPYAEHKAAVLSLIADKIAELEMENA